MIEQVWMKKTSFSGAAMLPDYAHLNIVVIVVGGIVFCSIGPWIILMTIKFQFVYFFLSKEARECYSVEL